MNKKFEKVKIFILMLMSLIYENKNNFQIKNVSYIGYNKVGNYKGEKKSYL